MKLIIGSRHKIEVTDIAAASAAYCQLRDESGEGASTWPKGRVGLHRISYNGKVWMDDKVAYSPYDLPAP